MGVAPVVLHTHATAVVTKQLIYVLPDSKRQSSIDNHERNIHSGAYGTLSLSNAKNIDRIKKNHIEWLSSGKRTSFASFLVGSVV